MTNDHATRAAVLSWDYREQPDMDHLALVLSELTDNLIHVYQPDTGSDQYAVVITTGPVDAAAVRQAFNRWMSGEEPDVFDLDR